MLINNCDINTLLLEHKGKEIKFKCNYKPFPYIQSMDLEKDKEAIITFEDLQEAYEMRFLLSEFIKQCEEYIGKWHQVKINNMEINEKEV